jgi:chitodextrinase
MATNTTNKPKKAHKLAGFFMNNQSKPQPFVVVVVVLLFAAVGARVLFNAFAAGDSLYLAPTAVTQSLGSNFTVTIHENSGTDAVNAVEADLAYDQTKLQFVSISTTTSAFDLSAVSGGGSGSVKIARAKSVTSLTGDQVVATVTFKALALGNTTVSFVSSSAIVSSTNNSNVLVATNPGIYTIADTTPPTVPTGLTAGTKALSSISLNWAASTDNVAVAGYKVFRNGTLVNGNVAATSYTDNGLSPNTSYTYSVAAFDAAGNISAQSTGLVVATLADTTPPTVPSGLTAGTKTMTSIAFSWTASTDNVAVKGYSVYRNGTKITSAGISTTNYTDSGLTPGTSYSYTVNAYDAAGNQSAQSLALVISTVADTTPPTVPTGLTSPSQTINSINLIWNASTDSVGVAGYTIYRNGTKIGTTATTTSYNDSGLAQGTSYAYTVSAYDSLGNTSATSAAINVSTTFKPGDINGDGKVDLIDLSILANHFGLCGQTRATGDLNGDGCVNIIDMSILSKYWGT